MKSVSIRNVPENLYSSLKVIAKANRRSLQEQIKYLLELEVRLNRGSPVVKAQEWRKRLSGRNLSDTVGSVREDRDR